MRFIWTLSTVLMLALASNAQAALITRTFDITASNFVWDPSTGSPLILPVQPIRLNFTATFDPAIDMAASTSGLTINSFNYPSTSQFTHDDFLDTLRIATQPTITGCFGMPGSYCVWIRNASGINPSVALFNQVTSSFGVWDAQTVVIFASPVPEPASWAMMVGGAGLIGSVQRRRRKSSYAVA